MRLGWKGFFGTVAVTATLTSAFWISLRPWQPEAAGAPSHLLSLQSDGSSFSQGPNERLVIPVAGVRAADLVDTYRDARSEGRVHDAIDIMAPLGTPVVAAAAGRVEKLHLSKAGGNTVYVRSRDRRTIYYYAHLDRYASGLAEGMSLAQRGPIGTVGFTGNASPEGPHLHFAVLRTAPERKYYEASTPENPYPLLTR